MRQTRAFLLDVEGMYRESIWDTEQLLIEAGVASANISRSDFAENYEQLPSGSTFAVAGGRTSKILNHLSPDIFSTVRRLVYEQRNHYIGICAGMVLSSAERRTFTGCVYRQKSFGFLQQPVYAAFKDRQHCGLKASKGIYAYETRVDYINDNDTLKQLYVNGSAVCMSDSVWQKQQKIDVVARYADVDYEFYSPKTSSCTEIKVAVKQPAAIVRSPVMGSKGGFLLFGTHVEASVNVSRVANDFASGAFLADVSPLKKDVPEYRNEQKPTLGSSIRLMKETFI